MTVNTVTAPAKGALYNTNCTPHELVMTFEGDKPKFQYMRIQQELIRFGITIPGGLEKQFDGRQVVAYPSEDRNPKSEDFSRFKSAFCDVYVPMKLKGYAFKLECN